MIPDAKRTPVRDWLWDTINGPYVYRVVCSGGGTGSIEYASTKSVAVEWATHGWLKCGGHWTVDALYPSGREKIVFDTNRYKVH